jgi:DNA polymerase-3 subunit alpha
LRKSETKISDLPLLESGKIVNLIGTIVSFKHHSTKKGEGFLKFILEDESGKVDILVFNSQIDVIENYLRKEGIIKIEGELKIEDERISLRLTKFIEFIHKSELDEKIKDLEIKEENRSNFHLYIKLKKEELKEDLLEKLSNFLKESKGTTPVTIYLLINGKKIEISLSEKFMVTLTPSLLSNLSKLIGIENFYYKEIS